MSVACDPEILAWAKILVPAAVTFCLGMLVPRFWLTRNERHGVDQKNFENTTKLVEQHDRAYDEYTGALRAFSDAPRADANAFFDIATKGDRYLYQLNLMAASILSGRIDVSVRDEVLMPKVRRAAAETLPDHYNTLRMIAARNGMQYDGDLRRDDYGAIYAVVEKFGKGHDWAR